LADFLACFSSYLGFSSGTLCLVREETPKETAKLKAEVYDYDSDSDFLYLMTKMTMERTSWAKNIDLQKVRP